MRLRPSGGSGAAERTRRERGRPRGRVRRKPRTGTGNRNEELVPGNFISAKGLTRWGENRGDKGTGIGCEDYSNCNRRKTAAPCRARDGFRLTAAQTHVLLCASAM